MMKIPGQELDGEFNPEQASVGGVAVARSANQQAGGGANPTSTLHKMEIKPIPTFWARTLIVKEHYLHSLPGGTHLAFGVFVESRLLGALTLGVGPFNAYSMVEGARPDDCLTLTRLWLSDELPKNSESRILGIVIRSLKHHTNVKFLVSYADPAQEHLGTIYQAANWVYTGLSQATPLYDIGDGKVRHSRSLSHAFGSHSVEHFANHGIEAKLVPQAAKHRYMYFLDPTWRSGLQVAVHPYPKSAIKSHGGNP